MPSLTLQPKAGPKGTFLDELKRRQTSFSAKIGAKIQGASSGGEIGFDENPEDLSWVIFQEFGTATRREGDPLRGIPGPSSAKYPIPKEGTTFLRFPDPFNKFPEHLKNAEGDVVLFSVEHPGIRPGGFIRSVLDGDDSLIKVVVKTSVLNIILNESNPYNERTLLEQLIANIMPQVKDIIATSMGKVLTGTREDGRLNGRTAEEVFREAALIVENNEF